LRLGEPAALPQEGNAAAQSPRIPRIQLQRPRGAVGCLLVAAQALREPPGRDVHLRILGPQIEGGPRGRLRLRESSGSLQELHPAVTYTSGSPGRRSSAACAASSASANRPAFQRNSTRLRSAQECSGSSSSARSVWWIAS